jgi:hypothetical protein
MAKILLFPQLQPQLISTEAVRTLLQPESRDFFYLMDSCLRFIDQDIFVAQLQGLKLISSRGNTISVSQESNCERLGLIVSKPETHQNKDTVTNFAEGLKVIYISSILEQSVINKLNSRFSHIPTILMYYKNKEKPEYKNSLI